MFWTIVAVDDACSRLRLPSGFASRRADKRAVRHSGSDGRHLWISGWRGAGRTRTGLARPRFMSAKKILEVRIGDAPSFADVDRPQRAVLDPMPNRRFADLQSVGDILDCLVSVLRHRMAPFALVCRKIARCRIVSLIKVKATAVFPRRMPPSNPDLLWVSGDRIGRGRSRSRRQSARPDLDLADACGSGWRRIGKRFPHGLVQ